MKVLEKFKELKLLFINQEVEPIPIKEKIKTPPNTDCLWDIEMIQIPPDIAHSRPNPNKVTRYTQKSIEMGCLDKPISVTKDTSYPNSPYVFLVDGFIRYQIARRFKLHNVPIRFVD